jgi:hypothetical protein
VISNPRIGQMVRLRYAPGRRRAAPYHDLVGRVVIVCRARRARNHGVEIDGVIVVVPAGQLQPVKTEGADA